MLIEVHNNGYGGLSPNYPDWDPTIPIRIHLSQLELFQLGSTYPNWDPTISTSIPIIGNAWKSNHSHLGSWKWTIDLNQDLLHVIPRLGYNFPPNEGIDIPNWGFLDRPTIGRFFYPNQNPIFPIGISMVPNQESLDDNNPTSHTMVQDTERSAGKVSNTLKAMQKRMS